jgi:hypothetical protein
VTRIAYWDKFGQPAKRPDPAYGLGTDSWWIDPVKVAALKQSHSIEQAQQVQASASTGNSSQQKTEAPKADAPAVATPSQDRGQTPIYGVLIGVVVGFVLGRLGRKK